MSEEIIKNILSGESSPYLLQHANNPVHWLVWNNDSLSIARRLNKPILLSIGYSACHWCHVMAHESFEDTETAALMNQHFINIKVDKEERPDIDRTYQNAHSLLTERAGGWPLTVFITPDTHMPIFAGTYFPLHETHGLPTFKSLLAHISEIWSSRKADIQLQSNSLQSTYALIHETTKPTETVLNNTASDIARNHIEKQFDSKNGGFSSAPKFPHPAILEFALKHWVKTSRLSQADPRILHCALYSLEKMAEGGIFDHLGGGFYRYSTDELWMIPHFEKMLYDNGPLLSLFSQAWQLNSNPIFFNTTNEIAIWTIREMQSPDGGYYSAQDADSEGIEGKFYVWPSSEINTLLNNAATEEKIDAKAIELFKLRFGLDLRANFEDSWHLHGYKNEAKLAHNSQYETEDLQQQFKQIRTYFLQHREKRIHPSTDTKILCAWNGLMIHGMANAGRLLEKPEYTESALKAAYFLKTHCWKNNHLSANFKDGKAMLNAYLDDYAFLIYGLLELLQSQWDNELYSWTLELADRLINQFEDSEYGGFYFTSHDHEEMIQRLKIFSDDAIPSGNAIAAQSLNRLGYLSGENQYNKAAEKCLKSAWSSINHDPISHCAILNALNEYLTPPNILIMRPVESDVKNWQKITQHYHLADTMIYNIPTDQTLHSTLSGKVAGSSSRAYPCCGTQCHPPIKTSNELHSFLRNNSYRVLE